MPNYRLSVSLLAAAALFAPACLHARDPQAPPLSAYLLPDTAAADGNLAEWAGVPAVGPEAFKALANEQPVVPAPGFAPSLRCGRKAGSPDLFFLVVVLDNQSRSSDEGDWAAPDNVEIWLDFGRATRAAADLEWYKKNTWTTVREMGQFGLRPGTLTSTPKLFFATSAKRWKADFAATPVEGGMAYELRVDGQSVLDDLQLKALPALIGFDVGITDLDCPVTLTAGDWNNEPAPYRLFGDGMNHAFPNKYGSLALDPLPPDPAAAPPPRTLSALYGDKPDAKALADGLDALTDAAEADLVFWAALHGVRPDAAFYARLFAAERPLAQEQALAALYAFRDPPEAIAVAVAGAYAQATRATAPAVVLANLLNRESDLGLRDALPALLDHADLAVAVSAAKALATAGTAADAQELAKRCEALRALAAGADSPEKPRAARLLTAFSAALEELEARVIPLPEPTAVTRRAILAENTDLPRHLPSDNNKVYNAAGLARTWPAEGPPTLWRADVGDGLAAVIESHGRTFTVGLADGRLYALCLDPHDGTVLWMRPLADKGGDATVTPLADGDNLYVVTPTVMCLDAATGETVWTENTAYRGALYSTPLAMGDVLYVGASHPSALVAVDKRTGKMLWSTPPGRTCSPASPAWQEIDGTAQIVLGAAVGNAKPEIWGVNAQTGEILWTRPFNVRYGLCASPVIDGARIYLCGGHGPQISECVQAFVRDGRIGARLLYRKDRIQSNTHNTPAIQDGAVYGFGPDALQCSRLAAGALLWRQPWQETRRHLLLADGLLFITTSDGELVMAAAAKDAYRELGRFKTGIDLSGDTQQMTLANGRLYLRGKGKLACFDLRARP